MPRVSEKAIGRLRKKAAAKGVTVSHAQATIKARKSAKLGAELSSKPLERALHEQKKRRVIKASGVKKPIMSFWPEKPRVSGKYFKRIPAIGSILAARSVYEKYAK